MSLWWVWRGNARFDQAIARRCTPDLDATNRRERIRQAWRIVRVMLWMVGLAMAYWRLSHG